MHASRLVRVARDILNEYENLKLITLLREAATFAQQRPSMNDSGYATGARQFRERANSVISASRFRMYPIELRDLLSKSAYAPALPERLAAIVRDGFPDDKNAAISSAELNMAAAFAERTAHELGLLTSAAAKFGVEEIHIPEGMISLDVLLPRGSFDDRAKAFVEKLATFVSALSYFDECATGSAGAPRLIYCSTTDPITAIGCAAGAVYGFLQLYKLLLEVAEKQLSMLTALKELRKHSAHDPDFGKFGERFNEIVERQLEDAVRKALRSMPTNVADDRMNEIENAVNKEAPGILAALSTGARINVTIESINQLNLISEQVPNVSLPEIQKQLEEQTQRGQTLSEARALYNRPDPYLIPADKQST
jgi:hypothetical protein